MRARAERSSKESPDRAALGAPGEPVPAAAKAGPRNSLSKDNRDAPAVRMRAKNGA